MGYEALARWPGLTDLAPDKVFAHAGTNGTMHALDQMCIDAALATALDAGLSRGALLCVNTEPATPYVGRTRDALLARGHGQLTVMFEITERSVLAHPRSLLRKVAAVRADGFSIALDDVGAQPQSITLLDIVRPDVIKLDLALVQNQPSDAQARTLDAVLAHHERTNAIILAEGIETNEHLEQALAVGATLGQGYMFGHPGPLDRDAAAVRLTPAPAQTYDCITTSPFELVAGTSPVRTARKETLLALSRHIESQAEQAADPPMVFTALQRGEYFSGATSNRYRTLAGTCPMVVVFGRNMPADLGSGVRGVNLEAGDPMCGEWTVVSIGPHNATALIAREHDDNHHGLRDEDRRFDFVITYNRPLVAAAARGLLDRVQ